MVTVLLDTSIVIDLLRGYPNSEQWLQSQTEELGVTLYVWLEVLEGANNKANQQRAIALLNQFALVKTLSEDVDWSVQQLIQYNLSHNLDSIDCLIAAPAYRLQIPLYTRNLKHFRPLLGNQAIAPYG
jgi:predicted nucleic acid-binding protein